MTDAAAFQGTIHSFKTIPSRSVVSITVECPIEQLANIARIAEHGAWVAVARLGVPQEKPAKDKRDWKELQPAAQAGIRAGDPIFRAFLTEHYDSRPATEDDAAQLIRDICGVNSRVELGTRHAARIMWHQLDEKFLAWKARENA